MIGDKARHEKVGMIVAFLHAQSQFLSGGGARVFEQFRFQRFCEEIVSGSLVEDERSPEMFFFSRYVYRPNPIVAEN